MIWEYVIVGIIVLAAALVVVRNLFRKVSGNERGCEGCPHAGECSAPRADQAASQCDRSSPLKVHGTLRTRGG